MKPRFVYTLAIYHLAYVCDRFASDEKRLQGHIIGHRYTDIDNSSHACTICSRQFKLRFSLKNHMFKVSGWRRQWVEHVDVKKNERVSRS